MANKKILVLVPARFQSSRFPGKPLAPILGKPMIQWVYERLSDQTSSSVKFDVCVVTDDVRIQNEVESFEGNVCLVSDETESGTERIALALERNFSKNNYDLVINVQGDEPLIETGVIEKLSKFHLASDFDIATAVTEDNEIESDPNTVKAIFSPDSGRCLYFSRAGIPYHRKSRDKKFYAHIGIYSFKTEALKRFSELPLGHYEKIESLEQLRALENGLTIGAIKLNERLMGVDTPRDIAKVEEKLNE